MRLVHSPIQVFKYRRCLSKAGDKRNRRLFYAIILTTAACLAVQGCKGQPDGSLEKGTGLELVDTFVAGIAVKSVLVFTP